MQHKTYNRNHVIIPGRETALHTFLNATLNGEKHKLVHCKNSNSEDALTWSCFEMIKNLPLAKKISVLDEIMEDAYEGNCNFKFRDKSYSEDQIKIHIGKPYTGIITGEETELDVSIELPDKLIFIEAKLYSTISLADGTRPDQIARKLRVGLDSCGDKEFYFIFLDIAPNGHFIKNKSLEEANKKGKGGLEDKWLSAWWFNYYKNGSKDNWKQISNCLKGIKTAPADKIAANMGWLTWSDLYKNILRGMVS